MDWHSVRTFRRCARNGRQQPVLYTNFLLRCFVHSIAACLRDSLMITSLALDGIPLAPKYLKILSDGLANNRNLRSLSLARCRIGDTGCDILLESLQHNPNLRILNLSSCCLTNRSAASLSLFFKKRKADLLQNMWKESTLSQKEACATMEEGLRVLILNKNHKFSNVSLRQLIRMLKHDFWLRTLCLQCCGITQHGGEIALELLQTNSVLTHIDLRDNEVSTDVLHTIRKILKKRKSREERIPMKKRLLNRKHVLRQETISKKASSDYAPKDNEFSANQVQSKSKMQCVSKVTQSVRAWKTENKDNRKCKSRSTLRKNHIKWTNVDKLKKCLMLMIEGNQSLIAALENSTDFLMKERDRRLSAEEAYHKLQPRLRSLRNKIIMQNSIHSSMHYENQVYTNLQNVFNELRHA
ncbi:hypothetical protein DMN91_011697 [Ooceraea biroi]|uniref:Protein Cep78-like protein n=1 Tax=Ooceraea biroi TaxID=2015173 RepID=A0A3L8D6Q4_OOCBI|nr:protein Cep78 homolog [Ooceraea biroi]RLU15939.1 hypothetical protein DMN91_011697 [Ooceraea biroi]